MTAVVPHSFEHFRETITQRLGDPTFSVLKAHLLFEEMLNAYIWRTLPNASALTGARLSFAQRLAIARACSMLNDNGWHWEALAKLNQLRNELSHRLQSNERDGRIGAYVTFVTTSFGVPLPPPVYPLQGVRFQGEPAYSAIDLANRLLKNPSTAAIR